MNNPLVSVIIPTYNRAHIIGETLDSVLAQAYQNWECIIVDDGSTDNSEAIINTYVNKDSRFQYHIRPADRLKGGNAARNYGFEMCKGEYVNWFDSDDLMSVDLLLKKINLFKNQSNLGFVACGFTTFKDSIIIKEYRNLKNDNYIKNYIYDEKSNYALNSLNVLWKKDCIKVVKWDELIYKFQDLDYIFRIFNQGFLIHGDSIDESLIKVRICINSISVNNDFKNVQSRLKVRRNMFIMSENSGDKYLSQRLFHLYLYEIKEAMICRQYKICFQELFSKYINLKVKFYFLLILISYYFFNKGSFIITKVISKNS